MNRNRHILYESGFLFSLTLALTYYINSTFLSSFVGEGRVGFVYTLSSLASLLALLATPVLFRKIGAYRFLLFAALLSAVSYGSLAFVEHPLSAIIVFILSFSSGTLVCFALDEFLKICSEDCNIGAIRGVYLVVIHIALIATQFAFWMGLGLFPLRSIYLIASATAFCFLLVSALRLKGTREPDYDSVRTLAFVGQFFRERNLFRAYCLAVLLQLFYVWMIIYTPIYLSVHLGFSWEQIGIIFSFMLLPFLILPYFLGKHGDRFGERRMLMFGFFVASLATLSLFFISARIVWIWAAALFCTRIGAATVEVMADAYFFKHIRPENEEFIGVYRSATPVAFILGSSLASLIFLVVPSFNYMYVILGCIMLLGIYLASTISRDDM